MGKLIMKEFTYNKIIMEPLKKIIIDPEIVNSIDKEIVKILKDVEFTEENLNRIIESIFIVLRSLIIGYTSYYNKCQEIRKIINMEIKNKKA